MNLDLIQMNQQEALNAYKNYHKALKLSHNKIDHALTRGYRALSKGKKLIGSTFNT